MREFLRKRHAGSESASRPYPGGPHTRTDPTRWSTRSHSRAPTTDQPYLPTDIARGASRECAQSPTAGALGASSGTPGRASRTRSSLRRARPRPTRRGAHRCRSTCGDPWPGPPPRGSAATRNRKRHARTRAHGRASCTGAPGASWPSCCPRARPRAASTGQQTCHTHANRGTAVSGGSRKRRRGDLVGRYGKESS